MTFHLVSRIGDAKNSILRNICAFSESFLVQYVEPEGGAKEWVIRSVQGFPDHFDGIHIVTDAISFAFFV
jgi:hypothetical protein